MFAKGKVKTYEMHVFIIIFIFKNKDVKCCSYTNNYYIDVTFSINIRLHQSS